MKLISYRMYVDCHSGRKLDWTEGEAMPPFGFGLLEGRAGEYDKETGEGVLIVHSILSGHVYDILSFEEKYFCKHPPKPAPNSNLLKMRPTVDMCTVERDSERRLYSLTYCKECEVAWWKGALIK